MIVVILWYLSGWIEKILLLLPVWFDLTKSMMHQDFEEYEWVQKGCLPGYSESI